MILYSEYVIQEGVADIWKVIVNKAKQILWVTPLSSIKNLLAKIHVGKFFTGKVPVDSLNTVTKGKNNMKANIEWLLSQSGSSDVREALNGFFAGSETSDVPQIDKEDMTEILENLMDQISESSYNPKNEHDIDVPCFYGAIGIGKTTILKEVIHQWNATTDNKRGLILLDGGQLTSDAFLLPSLVDVNKQKDAIASIIDVEVDTNTKDERLGAAPASFLPLYKPTGDYAEDAKLDAIANGHTGVEGISVDGGLIVVDEFFRADPSVFKNIMNIMQQRRAGGGEYVLGSKWAFVLLSNRPCDDDEVADSYDRASAAFFGRITPYLYIPRPQDWYGWAETDGNINHIVIDYVKQDETKFHKDTSDKHFTLDPRNWEKVSKIVDRALNGPKYKDNKGKLLEDISKLHLLKSASDAVSISSDEKCPLILKNIAAVIGTSEAKEFCKYWSDQLDLELNGTNNNTEDELDGTKKTVGVGADVVMKEEVDDPSLIFKVTDSDAAVNLGSNKILAPLRYSSSASIQPKKGRINNLDSMFVTLFGVYKGSESADNVFTTRKLTVEADTSNDTLRVTFAPAKGGADTATGVDLDILTDAIKGSDLSYQQKITMFANFILLNNATIVASDKFYDRLWQAIGYMTENGLYDHKEVVDLVTLRLEYIVALILLKAGSDSSAMRSQLKKEVYLFYKNVPSELDTILRQIVTDNIIL